MAHHSGVGRELAANGAPKKQRFDRDGVDYSVNVMARYRQTGSRDVIEAIRSTGGAVAVCSLTTIIGYGSLLLAKNQALFLFGLVAVLGEVTCLIAAVVVLPAVLAARSGRAADEPRVALNQ